MAPSFIAELMTEKSSTEAPRSAIDTIRTTSKRVAPTTTTLLAMASTGIMPTTTTTTRLSQQPNDNQTMSEFFDHVQSKETTSNKLVSIRELVAKNQVSRDRSGAKLRASEQVLSELLAKRSGVTVKASSENVPEKAVDTAKQPTDNGAVDQSTRPNQRSESSAKDTRKNALTEMLAKRTSSSESDNVASTAHPLAAMLAKRNSTVESNDRQSDDRKKALGAMLAKRTSSSESDSVAPAAHPLAAMLVKRNSTVDTRERPEDDRKKALGAMLAKRTSSSESDTVAPTAHPLAAMLAKRQAPPPTPTSAPAPISAPTPTPTPTSTTNEIPLKDHPEYGTFFKMIKIGHPRDVVRHAMQRNGVDPLLLDEDPTKPLDAALVTYYAALAVYKTSMGKYEQMLKMGLPRGAVEHKMRMDNLDPAWLDAPPVRPTRVIASGPTPDEIEAHKVKYASYFQMLKLGLPRGAVEHKMRKDGVDPRNLDGPIITAAATTATTTNTTTRSTTAPSAPMPVKRANSIRKKIHWQVKRSDSLRSNPHRESLWNGSLSEDTLSHVRMSKESKELLEKLFVKSMTTNPASSSSTSADKTKNGKHNKKHVMYLIDMKKSQNIAITLARIKLSYRELKQEILALNPTVLSTAQLQSLMDMWPDKTEQEAVDNFHGDDTMIGAAEKFLVETRNIPRFREKMGCLIFKQEFPTRMHELRESIQLVIRGVNQVCSSTALRQLFIYILKTGNLLNFGANLNTEDDEELLQAGGGGFSLGSLVKLSQTKAFTGGVTFLQYVVQSIDRDIPQLAQFPRQINLIQKCAKVSISTIFAEKRALEDGVKALHHEAHAVIPVGGDKDAELAASILKHFAAEVDRELDALQDQLDQLMDCKARFLEYFEEEETSEELDVLLTYIANFTVEFEREHTKFQDAQQKREKQEQQKQQLQAKLAGKGDHTPHPHGHPPHQPHHHHHTHSHHHNHHKHIKVAKSGQAAVLDNLKRPSTVRVDEGATTTTA